MDAHCHMVVVGGVRCVRRFRLLGMGKCGTTALSVHINNHPDSVPYGQGRHEEIHFFRGDGGATVEGHARVDRVYAWGQAAAQQPRLMYGDGTPAVAGNNRGLWQPGVGVVYQHQHKAGGLEPVNVSQFMRAFDVKVCVCV